MGTGLDLPLGHYSFIGHHDPATDQLLQIVKILFPVNENIQDYNKQEQPVDYKIILFKFYRYWYFFAVTIFIALIIAFIFNKYTNSIYEVKTTILVKDKSENKLNPQDLLGMGMLNSMQNLQNEIGVLSSYTLSYRAVTKIGFEVSYTVEDNFVTKELYHDSPFKVILDTAYPQPVNLWFKIILLSKNNFRLETNDEAIKFYNYSKKKTIDGRVENVSLDDVLLRAGHPDQTV